MDIDDEEITMSAAGPGVAYYRFHPCGKRDDTLGCGSRTK
jgi:hypothetical protein